MKRNATLDILKGVCLILVIITHYPFTDEIRLRFLFDYWVVMAIPLCMLVTGYVYTLSFKRKDISTLDEAFSLRGGIIEHLIRYTVPFIITWILELVAFEVLDHREFLSPKELLQEFLCGAVGSGSYYYPIIVQTVFVFPLIYFCIKRHNLKGLIACSVANIIYELLQWAYGLNEGTYRLLVFRYIMLLSFGCYFGMGGKLNKPAAAILILVGAISIYLNTYRGVTLFFITSWKSTSFLTSLFAVPLFYYLLKLNIQFKPLELLGKASYNIFLVQMVAFRFGVPYVLGLFISSGILHFLACMMICLVGGVIFYYVETPITKACVKFYKNRILMPQSIKAVKQ